MTTLLAKQVAAFKQHHGITALGPKRAVAPSILFSPKEAKAMDAEFFAALALQGLGEAAVLEPKLESFRELFEGPVRSRDLLTKEENQSLDQKIHRLLLLLSPQLQARAAQETLEGLLHRYHVHRWNVDDLMASALPHHDSPLFTKLVQGLHVEGQARWSWLSSFKAKPATLIRSVLAKYCSKDVAVLAFLGEVMEETLEMQLSNRALMTFFTAIWLDTLALSAGAELVQVALPTLLLLLKQPTQQDAFFAGVTVTAALCTQAELEETVKGQLLLRLARQAFGTDGRPAFVLMADIMQLQEVHGFDGVLKVLSKNGPEELLRAASPAVDAGNLLGALVQAALASEEEKAQAWALGVLEDDATLRRHAAPLCRAVLRAAGAAAADGAAAVARFVAPARCLGRVPLALAEVVQEVPGNEQLEELLTPSCAGIREGETFLPAMQAFSHKSAKARIKATKKAVQELEEEGEGLEERQRLLAGLALGRLEDENAEVVAGVLEEETLWSSERVPITAAVSALLGLVARLVQGQSLEIPRALVPALRAAAWLRRRKGLKATEKSRLDASLVPLVLAMGLDDELQAAIQDFCKASSHPLLPLLAEQKKGSLAQALDVDEAGRLCDLVAGRPEEIDAETQETAPFLGGVAAQAACCRLLVALPSLLQTLRQTPRASKLLMQSVDACERFASHLSSLGMPLAPMTCLWKANLDAASAMARQKGGPEGKGEAREALQRLLLLALQQPKDLAADLQSALTADTLRPALFQVALGDGGTSSANGLRLLKSLISKRRWKMDQHVLVLALAKIADAQDPETQGAALALLGSLKECKAEEAVDTALVEAGLLVAATRKVALAKEVWQAMLELIETEEPQAVVPALTKALSPKGGLQKAQRLQAQAFWVTALARLKGRGDGLVAALPISALSSIKESLVSCVPQTLEGSALLSFATKLLATGSEKTKSSQEVAVDLSRSVLVPLLEGLENQVEWDSNLTNLATHSCRALARREAAAPLFRFAAAARSARPAAAEAAAAALAEVQLDAESLESLLKCEDLQGKRLKEPRGVAAAQLLCEQVVALTPCSGRVALLRSLAASAQQAGKQAKDGAGVVALLQAMAALSEQLAKEELEEDEASAATEALASLCEAVEAVEAAAGVGFAAVLRCCGAWAVLGPEPLQLLQRLLRKAPQLPSEVLALLKGSIKRLYRYPPSDDFWEPQARLRGLLCSISHVMEVSKSNCQALANSSGDRDSLDFVILLLLVKRSRQLPKPPKKRRRKVADEFHEALDELTAPSGEDLLQDEAFELLTSVEPAVRYHAFGMLLLSLSAWAAQLYSFDLAWNALMPEELLSEEGAFPVLRRGLQLASRFLSEHGLPSHLDAGEVDTRSYPDEEAEEGTAVSHGVRGICVVEALLTRSPGKGRAEVQCLQAAQKLRGLLLRSLSVNHPVTFFRGLCLSLGVKGYVPKGGWADQDFAAHLASSVMKSAAVALRDRRELRSEEDDEAPSQSAELCDANVRHICKRFLSGDDTAAAWALLEEICRFAKSFSSQPLLQQALPRAGSFLGSLEAGSASAVSCCQCVETMVTCLGREVLVGLNHFTPALLQLAEKPVEGEPALDGEVLKTLGSLCSGLGGFLSPFLGQLLRVLCAPAPTSRLKSLEVLGKQLVEGVPPRLLLKEVQSFTVDPFSEVGLEEGMLRMQRLCTFYLWILMKVTPEFVAAHDPSAALLRILAVTGSAVRHMEDIPRFLQREAAPVTGEGLQELSWSEVAQDASLSQMQLLGGAAFARFCLFLEPDVVKGRVVKVLDWARGKQDRLLARAAVKPEDASKTLALLAALRALSAEAEGLGEELLPFTTKDLAAALRASHSLALQLVKEKAPKKKRRASLPRAAKEVLNEHTWWWYDVSGSCFQFLTLAFRGAAGAEKVWEESLEELIEPAVAVLDILEFLQGELREALAAKLQTALVTMTAAAGGDFVKRIMQAVLEKTRSEDYEVRLAALGCAQRIWTELGVQVVTSLSEVILYASELQDDEEPRVEQAVKRLKRTIEECTGESLEEAMKT